MEANLRDGVVKLVDPGERTFSSSSSLIEGAGDGDGSGTDSLPERRSLTLDSNLRNMPPPPPDSVALSFPLLFDDDESVAKSSAATGFLERRKLCSRDERMRVAKGLIVDSSR